MGEERSEVSQPGSESRQVPAWLPYASVVAAASAPFVGFITDNQGQMVDAGLVAKWWAVALVGSIMVVGLAHRVEGRGTAAWMGLVLSLALYLLLAFPSQELRNRFGSGATPGLIWGAVAILALMIVWWLGRTRVMQVFVAMASFGLLLTSMIPSPGRASAAGPDTVGTPTLTSTELPTVSPDVWYLVLDGHADLGYFASDTDYDPMPFAQALEARGFRIQADAESAYPFTYVSVASVLEMDYLHSGSEQPRRLPYFNSIQGDNETVRTFLDAGYAYTRSYSGFWQASRCSGIEDFCTGDESLLNATAVGLRAMTPFPGVGEDAADRQALALASDPATVVQRILAADVPSPSFNFLHMMAPHAPFLRDAECGLRAVPYELGNWETPAEYAHATACLHGQLETAVDAILQRDPEAIIVLQGDHGHRLGLHEEFSSGDLVVEDDWFETFSAIRLPSRCAQLTIPDDLVIVNTFRLVFACLQGTDPVPLPNRRVPMVLD